jgi:hypothetical protein
MVDVKSNLKRGEKVLQVLKPHWKHFLSAKSFVSFSIAPIITVNTNRVVVTDKRVFSITTDIQGNTKSIEEYPVDKIKDLTLKGLKGDCATLVLVLKDDSEVEFKKLQVSDDFEASVAPILSQKNALNQMFS